MQQAYSFSGLFAGLYRQFAGVFRRPEANSGVVFEGYISGYQYHEGQQLEHLFREGTQFTLKHEPLNPFDENAVGVYYGSSKVGFLPYYTNAIIAGMIREGRKLKARVARFDARREPWERILVEVLKEEESSSNTA